MKIKFFLINIIFLLFGACFGMSGSGEVGQKVIDDMRTTLKEPCLDLLASSNLVDWYTFEKRVQTLKDAVTAFENNLSQLKGSQPATVQSMPIPEPPAPVVSPVAAPEPAIPTTPTPVAAEPLPAQTVTPAQMTPPSTVPETPTSTVIPEPNVPPAPATPTLEPQALPQQ